MEIIMQWLDDADDFVFALVQMLERLRRLCLDLGFAAACALVFLEIADVFGGWVPALAGIACGGLVMWTAGLAARGLPRVPAGALTR